MARHRPRLLPARGWARPPTASPPSFPFPCFNRNDDLPSPCFHDDGGSRPRPVRRLPPSHPVSSTTNAPIHPAGSATSGVVCTICLAMSCSPRSGALLPVAAPAMKGFTMSLTSTRGPLPTEKLRQKAILRYSQHEADALASPSPLTSRRDQPSTDQQGTSRPPRCRRSRTGITSHVLLLQVTRLPDLHGVPMAAFNAYNSPSIVPSCCLCLCLMINVPGRRLRGLWIGRHWVEIRKIDGIWFNLDIDLPPGKQLECK